MRVFSIFGTHHEENRRDHTESYYNQELYLCFKIVVQKKPTVAIVTSKGHFSSNSFKKLPKALFSTECFSPQDHFPLVSVH